MSNPQQSVVNALSFDIEDWFHMVEIEAVANVSKWDTWESLVERYTQWIIETVTEAGVHATFFVLGWIAERYPQLVRSIVENGHEVASHSYWHRKVYELDANSFSEDLRRSIDVIEDAGGQRVRGFRAPSFSITPGSEWAMDVLLDAGLEYDASLFPASRAHGGYPCDPAPHVSAIAPSGRPIHELPMTMMKLGSHHSAILWRWLHAVASRVDIAPWVSTTQRDGASSSGLFTSKGLRARLSSRAHALEASL